MKNLFLFVGMLVVGIVMWLYRWSDYVPGIFLAIGMYLVVAQRRPTHGTTAPGLMQTISTLGGLGLVVSMAYSLWKGPHYQVVYGCGSLFLLLLLICVERKEFTQGVPRRNVVWSIALAAFLGLFVSFTILVVR